MERKQLIEKLKLMKKEYARKQRKLKKANRAASVKAHVKQKIHELNLQAKDDQHWQQPISPNDQNAQTDSGQVVSSPNDTVVGENNQHLPTLVHKPPEKDSLNPCITNVRNENCLSGKDTVMDPAETNKKDSLSSDGKGFTLYDVGESDQKTDAKKPCQQLNNPSMEKEDKKTYNFVQERSDLNESAGGQNLPVVLDTDDSLAVTPTFKSLRDTFTSFPGTYDQNLHLVSDRFSNIDSYTNTFSLNLNSEAHLQSSKSGVEQSEDSLTLKNKDRLVDTLVENQSENAGPLNLKARKCPSLVECLSVSADMKTEVTFRNQENLAHESETPAMEPVSADSSVPVPVFKQSCERPVLRLEDISCEENIAPTKNDHAFLSSSEKALPDQLLDYTELDAIPFSQFELTEDFLSESSQLNFNGSQGGKKRKGMLSLVQRRSLRLSSFEFDSCNRSASDKQQEYHLGCRKTALYKMARKQKKTKKALFLSSLFQYLIDEAKRDTSFVEFRLPTDITQLTSCSQEGIVAENQPVNESLSQCTNVKQRTTDSLDTDVIPETEVIPDFESQKISTEIFNSCAKDKQQADKQSQSKLKTSLLKFEASAIEVKHHTQGSTETASDTLNKLPFTTENPPSLPVCPAELNTHCNVNVDTSDSVNKSFDREAEYQAVEMKMQAKSPVSTAHAKETTVSADTTNIMAEELLSSDSPSVKTESADVNQDHVISRLHIPYAGGGDDNLATASVNCLKHYSVREQSPKKETQAPTMTRDTFSSPVLRGVQPESIKEGVDQDCQKERCKPVFTPSKSHDRDEPVEITDQTEIKNRCWVKFAGCAESGCTDAVVDTIVGTAVSNGEEVAFILCVQTTALTLWTLDDKQQWSAEFHWYLQESSKADGACRVYSSGKHLAVLVWSFDLLPSAPSFALTVFVYHWDSQHTQRLSLPLPSPVCPNRVFCHGLVSLEDSLLVFTSDKSFTVGKRYTLDKLHSCISMELTMEATTAQLADLRLVDDLPDAVVGLTVDQKVLIWNHRNGALVSAMSLPDNLLTFSRMYSCYSIQGYLFFHMAEGKDSKELSLIALNPATATGKVMRKFTSSSGQHTNWLRVFSFQDILLTVSISGTAHLWDACCGELLSISNPSSNIQTAVLLNAKDLCILLTGQENGCLHLFSVCV